MCWASVFCFILQKLSNKKRAGLQSAFLNTFLTGFLKITDTFFKSDFFLLPLDVSYHSRMVNLCRIMSKGKKKMHFKAEICPVQAYNLLMCKKNICRKNKMPCMGFIRGSNGILFSAFDISCIIDDISGVVLYGIAAITDDIFKIIYDRIIDRIVCPFCYDSRLYQVVACPDVACLSPFIR